MAEAVGFEPTGDFTRHSISSRDRYDHFDTPPYGSRHPRAKRSSQTDGIIPQKFEKSNPFLKKSLEIFKNISSTFSGKRLDKPACLWYNTDVWGYPLFWGH